MSSAPKRRPPPHTGNPETLAPNTYLDGDCTPQHIIEILSNLKFKDGRATVEIDRPAAAYLISSVSARCGDNTRA